MRLPTVLLTTVYVTALCLALRDPSDHALAGAVVLAGLVTRWATRRRRRPDPAVGTARRLRPTDATRPAGTWLPAGQPVPTGPTADGAVAFAPPAPAPTGTAPA